MQTAISALIAVTALVLILYYRYNTRRRLQRHARFRIHVMKSDGAAHGKARGAFLFYLTPSDDRLSEIVVTALRISDAAFHVNSFDKLSFDVQGSTAEMTPRSIGFSCRKSALARIGSRKGTLTIRGYVVLNRRDRNAFVYRIPLARLDVVDSYTVKT